ncbi:glycosyltransferase family 2 protein [Acinetobacter sp. SWAC5]|uniref:glycosyltransferase family 2 protein n=1 Tax=Acinetobacter sp. SWAC5 TaxID=2293835 RepID=UPI000E34F220|nr:glycosyltransferase family 2 protein [Acinetobacter sp. SWAC5]RFS33269.1 glycosyltransferase family 2 protein [Acinetobacter sp. SWAC5]
MNTPLISIIIPMYNREKTINECLNSVSQQTYRNIEILVVDDCSYDESVNIVKNYLDNRVKLVQLDKNSGAQVARNRGIIEAKGEWIAFNDSDDIWMLNKLEKQLNILEANHFKKNIVIHSDCKCFDEESGKEWVWNVPKTEGSCLELLLKRPAPLFPTLLTSKENLYNCGMLDEDVPSYQEWDTVIKLAQKSIFFHIREPLFTYMLHQGETISKDTKRDIEGYLYIINKYRNQMESYKFYDRHILNLVLKSISFELFDYAERIIDFHKKSSFLVFLLCILIKYRIRNKYVIRFITKVFL